MSTKVAGNLVALEFTLTGLMGWRYCNVWRTPSMFDAKTTRAVQRILPSSAHQSHETRLEQTKFLHGTSSAALSSIFRRGVTSTCDLVEAGLVPFGGESCYGINGVNLARVQPFVCLADVSASGYPLSAFRYARDAARQAWSPERSKYLLRMIDRETSGKSLDCDTMLSRWYNIVFLEQRRQLLFPRLEPFEQMLILNPFPVIVGAPEGLGDRRPPRGFTDISDEVRVAHVPRERCIVFVPQTKLLPCQLLSAAYGFTGTVVGMDELPSIAGEQTPLREKITTTLDKLSQTGLAEMTDEHRAVIAQSYSDDTATRLAAFRSLLHIPHGSSLDEIERLLSQASGEEQPNYLECLHEFTSSIERMSGEMRVTFRQCLRRLSKRELPGDVMGLVKATLERVRTIGGD